MKIDDINKIFQHEQLEPSLLEGERGIDVQKVYIDVVKRDAEEGKYNIDMIVYVMPGLNPNLVMPAIQKACIDTFGKDRHQDIEVFYSDGTVDGKVFGVEVAGKSGVYHSFGVTILHPTSTFFNLETLTNVFKKRVHAHIEAI